MMRRFVLLLSVLSVSACGSVDPDAAATPLITAGSADETAVLLLVNDRAMTFAVLDDDVGLDRRAAENIVAFRDGADGVEGNADDRSFRGIAELDAIAYVGETALADLLAYARAQGYGGPAEVHPREAVILGVVNDPANGFEVLDDEVGLDRRAAGNLVAHRAGDDGLLDTADDRLFAILGEVDAIPYVGPTALEALFEWGVLRGYGAPAGEDSVADVIFSPQPFATSHATRAIELIDGAEHSIDIAMYSFSLGSVYDAIERATARGVQVRMIFETASEDRRLSGAELDRTRSARLERMGVQVRWVNKIMHHKLAIVDGPRDDRSRAATARITTGSANWSGGAATRYDENTLFLRGVPELALRLQAEFEHLWAHSRDLVWDASLPFELGTADLSVGDAERDDVHAIFTSANFSVSGDTFRITDSSVVSDALVEAIGRAQRSIHVASGHLRSRPVAEALMAAKAANPALDVRVYLDGQEWISSWYQGEQERELVDCLAEATTATQERNCRERGFLFGYAVGQAGIDVRYKYYAYRWHYTYADQMHDKLMILDGEELWTGSYNLSDNAERNTMENMLMFRGERFAALIAAYEAQFEAMWETHRRDGTLEETLADVRTGDVIPLVFDSVAMTWGEVEFLKDAIRANCALINSEPYRTRPEDHRICPR